MAECTFQKSHETEQQSTPRSSDRSVATEAHTNIWLVYVDGSSAQEGAVTDILFMGLDKEEFKCSIKFTFLITNNATEYETLLAGL